MSDVVNLEHRRTQRDIDEFTAVANNTSGALPELDITRLGKNIAFRALLASKPDETGDTDELSIVIYEIEGDAGRPVGVLRVAAVQWHGLATCGARMLEAEEELTEELKKGS